VKIFFGSSPLEGRIPPVLRTSPLIKGGIMLAGSFYPLNKGVAALCGGGILSKEQISDMAYLSPNKKWGMARSGSIIDMGNRNVYILRLPDILKFF